MQLTLFEVVDDFSPLLELLVPFSISQRFPNVGLPRAARAPCSKRRLKLKSGKEKDERFRRMLPLGVSFLSSSLKYGSILMGNNFSSSIFVYYANEITPLDWRRFYVWIVMAIDTNHLSLVSYATWFTIKDSPLWLWLILNFREAEKLFRFSR